jgi:hypothetical protein
MAGELMIAFTNPPTKTVPAHIRDLESPLGARYLDNDNTKTIISPPPSLRRDIRV